MLVGVGNNVSSLKSKVIYPYFEQHYFQAKSNYDHYLCQYSYFTVGEAQGS